MPLFLMQCPNCQQGMNKHGQRNGKQRWLCRNPECPIASITEGGSDRGRPKLGDEPLSQVEKNRRWYYNLTPEERREFNRNRRKK